MALAELPLILDAARDRVDVTSTSPAPWRPSALVPIEVSVHDLADRNLADLLAEEERLAHRAARTVLPAADSVRLRAVTAEIDSRWNVFLTRTR